MLLWITDVLNIACTQVVFTIKTHGYAVRDKKSYLPQLKMGFPVKSAPVKSAPSQIGLKMKVKSTPKNKKRINK